MSDETTPPSPTPGPWKTRQYVPIESNRWEVYFEEGNVTTLVAVTGFPEYARLIASAPELRDRLAEAERLLEKVARTLQHNKVHEKGGTWPHCLTCEARAFLARPKEGT